VREKSENQNVIYIIISNMAVVMLKTGRGVQSMKLSAMKRRIVEKYQISNEIAIYSARAAAERLEDARELRRRYGFAGNSGVLI
jgi:hypothetical protein